jgi:squalene synthase HpnC
MQNERKEQPATNCLCTTVWIYCREKFLLEMTTNEAFAYCQRVARRHQENFPVASLLLPRKGRKHVASIYAFARMADDFADEGDRPASERLALLDEWEGHLNSCYDGRAEHPVFIALRATIEATGIPRELLAALLHAFRMDVQVRRFPTFSEVLQYCTFSANPVGRLVLILFGEATEGALPLSDHLCTALQLANFWQDVGRDAEKDRIYLPLEDLGRFGYTEGAIFQGRADDRFRALMRYEVERTRRYFASGAPLLVMTRGTLRRELAATLRGGRAILEAIEREGYDTLHRRPSLSLLDKILMVWHAGQGTSA